MSARAERFQDLVSTTAESPTHDLSSAWQYGVRTSFRKLRESTRPSNLRGAPGRFSLGPAYR
jgi:hypothetical protein